MSRKVSALVAGWLATASIGLAQTGTPTTPTGKGRPMSPYYPTASTTADWPGDTAEPPDMPVIPVPRAPSPVLTVSGQLPALPPAPAAAAPASPILPQPTATPGVTAGCPAGCTTAPCTTCAPCATGPCGPEGCFWISAEYLLWWMRGMNVPPLVTASPAGTPRAMAGVLGAPGTSIVFGDDTVDDGVASGIRARAGFWLDKCQTWGFEGSFIFERISENHTFACNDAMPILARPFFNASPTSIVANSPSPDSELVCLPGVVMGTVNIETTTQLYGFDANIRRNFWCGCDYRIDGFAGYRYLNLQDRVTVTEDLTVTATNSATLPLGTNFIVQDQFQSTNQFNGGQVGVAGEWRTGRWFFTSRSAVALGNTHYDVDINGFTRVTVPGSMPAQNTGGLLAQPTNIGHHTGNEFSYVPETSMTAGYQLTDGIRAFVGYSLLYWTNVTRAGDQIDLTVNATQIPPGTLSGTARPTFVNRQNDFWTQGITFGLELRY